ncbi:DUF2207 domain-containing protein [Carnobacterium sp. TMP28]|uniref:DUF2207 domain-containing protein n=1 Tax=Carnobacterium sp. TMP28 TaxID=3397060 RepID=UPI0039DFB672
MNRKIRRIIIVGVAFLFSLAFSETVFAENKLSDITIEVELQKDGSAKVTEYRTMIMDEGTELYIVLDDLQDSALLDFSVAGFKESKTWDSDASLAEKTNRYGTVETGTGLELIWGIGEYGKNDYVVSYTLSNLVRELEDGQALLWNFDTFSDIPAENLTVKLTGFDPFTKESVRLWGFGFEGDLQLKGQTVVWRADEEVDSNNKVTVLLQFPQKQFNTQVTVNQTLKEQLEMATEGSAYNDETISDTVFIIVTLVILIVIIGGISLSIIYYRKVKKAKKEVGEMRSRAQRIKDNKGIRLKEIPYKGKDFVGLAYLLQDFNKGYFEDYFSAYLVDWSAQEKIAIHVDQKNSFFGDTFNTEIEIFHYKEERARYPQSFGHFVNELENGSGESYETGLWLMLVDAANRDGFIKDKDMTVWAKKHAKEVEKLANYSIEYSKKYLEKEGLLSFKEINVWNISQEVAIASSEGDKLVDRLIQFDNYLEEIKLEEFKGKQTPFTFRELLFWNILYFRSEEITKEFKGITPGQYYDYDDANYMYQPVYWHGMTGFRNDWSSGLESGGFHSTASSAAAGMGGSTSSGGGGGAGGGGGGGAR